MCDRSIDRRDFLAGAAGAVITGAKGARSATKLHVACASYSWEQFYLRDGRNFAASLDEGFAEVARSGLNGYEPGINAPADLDRLIPALKKSGLELRSVYVNTELHNADAAAEASRKVVEIAKKAKAEAGTRLIVTNPSPIRWGGPEDKDDAQLRRQAERLDTLGAELRRLGLTLAYHTHDVEMRKGAREFHHMMLATSPANVALCLDVHWIYRGCGDSSVALFDIVKLYGARIRELHIRQSSGGIWTEIFGPGDIDYPELVNQLARLKLKPHLVLEQAPEKGTPKTVSPLELHRASREYVDRVFARLG
jgi:inosose dehydratase